MGEPVQGLNTVEAILFDLHETLTYTNEGILTLMRKVSKEVGLDLARFTDDELNKAQEKVLEWIVPYQIDNDVDIHFGSEVEHWTEANRLTYETLGFEDISDDTLIMVEELWKKELNTWELLRSDAKSTLSELKRRGYQLGICTRRQDDPEELLKKWGILELMSTIQWSSVPGYSKPSPYTLILAADELGVNPLRCAFVGNFVDSDIHAAIRAGMVPILTTWADAEEAQKAPEGTYIIGEITELLDLFE